LAIEEIKQLKARYFRCMDTKDWDGFAEVFAADAVMDMSGALAIRRGRAAGGPLSQGDVTRGAAAIVARIREVVEALETVHHGHMPEIEVTSPTTARGVWSMEDKLRWPEDSPAAIRALHGYGHYHETYEKLDGRWKIKTFALTRLRVDVEADAAREHTRE